MLREMQSYISAISNVTMVALAFSILSVFAAICAHFVLTRLTRRTQFADKQFGAEVDPWMTEARRNYAKEKLVKRRDTSKP